MSRIKFHCVLFVTAVAAISLRTEQLEAQSFGINVTRALPQPRPIVVAAPDRMKDLKYFRARAAWHREARRQRQADLRERMRRRLDAWNTVVRNRREQRRKQTALYADRINASDGFITWPDLLTTNYPLEVDRLDDLFLDWAVGEGGVGSANYREVVQCTRVLKKKLKSSLKRSNRLTAREYIYLAHFVDELANTASRSPAIATAANDFSNDQMR